MKKIILGLFPAFLFMIGCGGFATNKGYLTDFRASQSEPNFSSEKKGINVILTPVDNIQAGVYYPNEKPQNIICHLRIQNNSDQTIQIHQNDVYLNVKGSSSRISLISDYKEFLKTSINRTMGYGGANAMAMTSKIENWQKNEFVFGNVLPSGSLDGFIIFNTEKEIPEITTRLQSNLTSNEGTLMIRLKADNDEVSFSFPAILDWNDTTLKKFGQ